MSTPSRKLSADELQYDLLGRNITIAIVIGFVAFTGACLYIINTAGGH